MPARGYQDSQLGTPIAVTFYLKFGLPNEHPDTPLLSSMIYPWRLDLDAREILTWKQIFALLVRAGAGPPTILHHPGPSITSYANLAQKLFDLRNHLDFNQPSQESTALDRELS